MKNDGRHWFRCDERRHSDANLDKPIAGASARTSCVRRGWAAVRSVSFSPSVVVSFAAGIREEEEYNKRWVFIPPTHRKRERGGGESSRRQQQPNEAESGE